MQCPDCSAVISGHVLLAFSNLPLQAKVSSVRNLTQDEVTSKKIKLVMGVRLKKPRT